MKKSPPTAVELRAPGTAAASRNRAVNAWIPFLVRRLVSLVLILSFLLFTTFIMVRLIPGDPAMTIGGIDSTETQRIEIRERLGLDQPLLSQLVKYGSGALRGDFGQSFAVAAPVSEVIGDRIGPSAQLAGLSLALIVLISTPLGMFAAHLTREGRHRRFEVVWAGGSGMLSAVPAYLLATVLIFLFAVWLRVLPVAGRQGWQSLVLPVAALSMGPVISLARIVRLQTLDALAHDYVRTARGKRLPWRTVYLRHILPNVLTYTLTVGGLLFAALIVGGVFVEQIFLRSGLGSALVTAVLANDYPVIQAIVLVLGTVVVIVNALIDILLALLDPRSLARQT